MTSKSLFAGAARADMNDGGSFPIAEIGSSTGGGCGLRPLLHGESSDRTARHASADRRRVALLAQALEAEVIPRLVMSRREGATPTYRNAADQRDLAAGDIETMTAHVLQGDLRSAAGFVAGLVGGGLPIERIFLELLAPTARHLGALWEADRCDFTSVTVGLCCLQQLVLDNSHAFGPRHGRSGVERRILLAPVPGEQHSFGLVMVGEFFRRQGWDVCSATGAAGSELVGTVRKQWFGIVGLSLAGDCRLEPLAALIRDMRRASRNPQLGILVGGRIFTEQPELAALVGADATASDGHQAVLKAETLLRLLGREA